MITSRDRRGIGRSLFEAITKWCEGAGITELQWQASPSAGPFYKSLGLVGDTKSDLEEYPFYEISFRPSD
jgi:GNAT superfamily N-acetyltransferase